MIDWTTRLRTFTLLLLLVLPIPTLAQEDGEKIAGGVIRRLHSRVLNGDRDSSKVTETVPGFLKQLRAAMPEGLRLKHVVLPGEGHVPASSLEMGITWTCANMVQQ